MQERAPEKPFRIYAICTHGIGDSVNRAQHIVCALTGEETKFGFRRPRNQEFRTKHDGIPFSISIRGLSWKNPWRRLRARELKDADLVFCRPEVIDPAILRKWGRQEVLRETERLRGEGKLYECTDDDFATPDKLREYIIGRMKARAAVRP